MSDVLSSAHEIASAVLAADGTARGHGEVVGGRRSTSAPQLLHRHPQAAGDAFGVEYGGEDQTDATEDRSELAGDAETESSSVNMIPPGTRNPAATAPETPEMPPR